MFTREMLPYLRVGLVVNDVREGEVKEVLRLR
jgi:hypothetical protein